MQDPWLTVEGSAEGPQRFSVTAVGMMESLARIERCAADRVVIRTEWTGGVAPGTDRFVGSVGIGRVVKCGSAVITPPANSTNDHSSSGYDTTTTTASNNTQRTRRQLRHGARVAYVAPRCRGGAALSTLSSFVEVPAAWIAVLMDDNDKKDEHAERLLTAAACLDLAAEVILVCRQLLQLRFPSSSLLVDGMSLDEDHRRQRRIALLSSGSAPIDRMSLDILQRIFGVTGILIDDGTMGVALAEAASWGPFNGAVLLGSSVWHRTAARHHHQPSPSEEEEGPVAVVKLLDPGSVCCLIGPCPTLQSTGEQDTPSFSSGALLRCAAERCVGVYWSDRDVWMDASSSPCGEWRTALAIAVAFIETGACAGVKPSLLIPLSLPSSRSDAPPVSARTTSMAMTAAAEDLTSVPHTLQRNAGGGAVIAIGFSTAH